MPELLQLIPMPLMIVGGVLDIVNNHCDQSLIGRCKGIQTPLLFLHSTPRPCRLWNDAATDDHLRIVDRLPEEIALYLALTASVQDSSGNTVTESSLQIQERQLSCKLHGL